MRVVDPVILSKEVSCEEAIMKCPGQDSRYWRPGAIFEVKCPKCDHEVEFFKDETTRRCRKCGHLLLNPGMDFGCASYCQYAAQCIGDLPPELIAQKEDLLKDRVAVEMKRHFQKDFKRIGHAMSVARYAERIAREEGGNLAVVLCAAYLHDIGRKEAEREHGSGAALLQEEGPPLARSILSRLGGREELIEEVCDILSRHHHPGGGESVNFRCFYDADRLADLAEARKGNQGRSDPETGLPFLTETGARIAREVLSSREA